MWELRTLWVDSHSGSRFATRMENEQIRAGADELRGFLARYGPFEFITRNELASKDTTHIWSDMGTGDATELWSDVYEDAHGYRLSTYPWERSDQITRIDTGYFIPCRFCQSVDDEGFYIDMVDEDCRCDGQGRLFIDLEQLLEDDSDQAIDGALEPA
jgi:hypothetical protein